jgi:hypothetical protein
MKTAGYGNFEATEVTWNGKMSFEYWRRSSTWKRCNRINRYHPVVLEQKQLLAAKTTILNQKMYNRN